MRIIRFTAGLAAIGLAVTACATQPGTETQIPGTAASDQTETPSEADNLQRKFEEMRDRELSNDEIWSLDAVGNLTHIQSGGICPLRWGEFVLTKPTVFNRNGLDVGCNFQSETLNSSFTFYFYLNADTPEQELDSVMSTIKVRAPTGRDVELNFLGSEPNYVGAAIQSEIEGGGSKRDAVLLAQDDGWRIKLRMTYPADAALEREHLAALMLQGQMDNVGRNGIATDSKSDDGELEFET